jgi:hypothetical protein
MDRKASQIVDKKVANIGNKRQQSEEVQENGRLLGGDEGINVVEKNRSANQE